MHVVQETFCLGTHLHWTAISPTTEQKSICQKARVTGYGNLVGLSSHLLKRMMPLLRVSQRRRRKAVVVDFKKGFCCLPCREGLGLTDGICSFGCVKVLAL